MRILARRRGGQLARGRAGGGAIYSSDALAFASVVFGTTDGYLYALG